MSFTPTEICNLALGEIDSHRIDAFGSGSTKNDVLCQEHFPLARAEALGLGVWSFARARQSLPQASAAPDFGYSYAYPLPADYVRLVEINGYLPNRAGHTIENHNGARAILTDYDVCQVIYIADTGDTTVYPPVFARAVVLMLAARLAVPLGNSAGQAAQLRQEAMLKLSEAMVIDASESKRGGVGVRDRLRSGSSVLKARTGNIDLDGNERLVASGSGDSGSDNSIDYQ